MGYMCDSCNNDIQNLLQKLEHSVLSLSVENSKVPSSEDIIKNAE